MADEQACDFPVSYRVLVVTSDQICAENLEGLLSQCKFQVTKISNGAIALLQEDSNKFDFVICDEHVADIDGFQLAQIISTCFKPAAYICSSDLYARMVTGIGVEWILPKPLRIEDLKHITECLQWLMRSRLKAARIC